MPLWIAATLTAALFQTWRTAMQQRLRGHLSVNAAAVVRYLYGVPVGALRRVQHQARELAQLFARARETAAGRGRGTRQDLRHAALS